MGGKGETFARTRELGETRSHARAAFGTPPFGFDRSRVCWFSSQLLMPAVDPTSYDLTPYPGAAYRQTHPERLAVMAALFGLNAAPVGSCRVLEIGCGDGANLLPMALTLPESRFTGFDLSARAIAQGEAMRHALKLENLALSQRDILAVTPELGEFDYIIAHGIYSWVPEMVRDRILAICEAHLAPNGVAYVSYNSYPGGHLRDMLREMLLFHVRDIREPAERARCALGFLDLLIRSRPDSDVYRAMLQEQRQRILRSVNEMGLAVFYHDALEEISEPISFHQFAADATRHGLQFLAEARLSSMRDDLHGPDATSLLRGCGDDIVAKEQYLDFLSCGSFRESLLCRAEIPLHRHLRPELVRNFFASCERQTLRGASDTADAEEENQGPLGVTMTKALSPLAVAALANLGNCFPARLHFRDLLQAVRENLNGEGEHPPALAEFLLEAFSWGVIDLHPTAAPLTIEVTERPVASPLARLQAGRQNVVTNLLHRAIKLQGPLASKLVTLLDGSRDRAAILKDLSPLIERREVVLQRPGQAADDIGAALGILADELPHQLERLARLALLMS